MAKKISVSDEVYYRIQKYQGPRETYSHVLERAFDAWETIDAIKRGEYPPFTDQERAKQEVSAKEWNTNR